MQTHHYGKSAPIIKVLHFKKRKTNRPPLLDDINLINGWRKRVLFTKQSTTLH